MKRLLSLVAVALVGGALGSAQKPDLCAAWKDVRAPKADMPPPSYASQAASCDELKLYYEGVSPSRLEAARWCAFASVDDYRDVRPGVPFHAPAPANEDKDEQNGDPVANLMLAMLYASGEGVRRNEAVAKHYACQAEDWFVPDEVVEEIGKGGRFEECGPDGGSGRIVNFACINLRTGEVNAALQRALPAAEAALRPELRALFHALVAARAKFRAAQEAEEPNGISGAVQSGMANDLDLNRLWLRELGDIVAGKAPAASVPASRLAEADKTLNANYQASLKDAREDPKCDSCTSEEQYRTAARDWLAYREAWVRFGTLARGAARSVAGVAYGRAQFFGRLQQLKRIC